MRNYVTLSAGCLAGLAIASIAIAEPMPSPQPPTAPLAQAAAASTRPLLSLEDLPPGFQALPPTVANQLAQQFEALSSQLSQAGVKPENFFVYWNPSTFQIIAGSTGRVEDVALFDDSLTRFEDESVREQLFAQAQGQLEGVGPVSVEGYEYLADMSNVADKSAGVSVDLLLLNQPFRADIATFRRGSTGAVTAVIYRAASSPEFTLRRLAEAVDGRLPVAAP